MPPSQSPPSWDLQLGLPRLPLAVAAENHAAKILHEKVHPHRDYGGPLYETYDAPKTRHSPCKCPDGQTNPFFLDGVAADYDHAAPGVLPPLSSAGIPRRRTHPNRELASGIT